MICFGPVPSRRLGKSLGINNICSPKTCSFGCVYCQVGRTLRRTVKRSRFYEADYIYENVCRHLSSISKSDFPDYLTFVSSGEPTLDTELGKSIIKLRGLGIKIAVITNSSLLWDRSVQQDLSVADLVSIKIDTVYSNTWQAINNPDPGLNFTRHLFGIKDFTDAYEGEVFTETMLVSGVNDSEDKLRGLSQFVGELNPSRAYISIPVRPPSEKWVKPPAPDILNRGWQIFNSAGITTELLTGFEGSVTGFTGNIYEDILNITAVHPLSEDALRILLHNDNSDFEVVESLLNQHLIRSSVYNGERFFIRDYHHNT